VDPKDVARAVAAARAAFPAFARTTPKERLHLLEAILAEHIKRRNDIAATLSQEMGAPLQFARECQAATGSNRAGILVAQASAKRVKRVAQELGGKSTSILMPTLTSEVRSPTAYSG
jgi:acyl-CoA reductase-like NAD-dependent aldehyde dehydrogenase